MNKRQSVKLEHIWQAETHTIGCTKCGQSMQMTHEFYNKEQAKLDFITAHRHEDIKSLEKGK